MTRLFRDYETASRVDLPTTGVSVYARDRSTSVQMCAYAFDDGPVQQFVPAEGDDVPAEFREALLDPHVEKRAWNNAFEWNIERHVMGIETPIESCRCTMAQAMTLSFPGSLDKVGEIVGIEEDKRKLSRGRLLVRKFSRPRKPTKGKPWLWASAATDPEDWDEYLAYNRNDVEAERAIWKRIRKYDLPEHEWALWVLDQKINDRGIPINLRVVENAIRLAGYVNRDRMATLRRITDLANPNSPKQLLPWLQEQGYPYEDLKKGHVAKALADTYDLCQEEFGAAEEHRDLIDVLEIRQEISKTSVKKYNALKLGSDADSRLRGAFQFAGAQRTWRWSGRRFQPQNLAKPAPWLEHELVQAVGHLERMEPEDLLLVYDKPMDLLSGCVRPVVQADPGHLFADADLSAIENVVLGWLSGDEAILRVFRDGLDPYIDFAVDMFRMPYDQIAAIVKAGDKTMRTQAKPPVLGCFGPETKVLTDSGWKRIVDVAATDKVHDGVEFVAHGGVVNQGRKEVVCMGGVFVTPDHKIMVEEGQWVEAGSLQEPQFRSAISSALGQLWQNWTQPEAPGGSISAAVGVALKGLLEDRRWSSGGVVAARPAPRARGEAMLENPLARTYMTGLQTDSTHSDPAVRTPKTPLITITVGAGSSVGSPMLKSLSSMLSRSLASRRPTKSTEQTTTGITSGETCAPQREASRTQTGKTATGSNTTERSSAEPSSTGGSPRDTVANRPSSGSSERDSRPSKSSTISNTVGALTTYDIVNAGPRHRFVILTNDGPVIAHNCGFMLSAGFEKLNPRTGEMEATGLLGYARNMGIDMTPEATKLAVEVWREKFSGAVDFWWELDRATRKCIKTSQPQRVGKITYDIKGSFMRAILPSGRALHYFKPRLIEKETPWGEKKMQVSYMGLDDKGQWNRITTHPGKLTENVVQAVARDLLANGMMLAHKRGLDLFLHVHDQIVAQVPEETAERDLATLIECMTELPRWAGNDLPLKAAGHLSRVFLKD